VTRPTSPGWCSAPNTGTHVDPPAHFFPRRRHRRRPPPWTSSSAPAIRRRPLTAGGPIDAHAAPGVPRSPFRHRPACLFKDHGPADGGAGSGRETGAGTGSGGGWEGGAPRRPRARGRRAHDPAPSLPNGARVARPSGGVRLVGAEHAVNRARDGRGGGGRECLPEEASFPRGRQVKPPEYPVHHILLGGRGRDRRGARPLGRPRPGAYQLVCSAPLRIAGGERARRPRARPHSPVTEIRRPGRHAHPPGGPPGGSRPTVLRRPGAGPNLVLHARGSRHRKRCSRGAERGFAPNRGRPRQQRRPSSSGSCPRSDCSPWRASGSPLVHDFRRPQGFREKPGCGAASPNRRPSWCFGHSHTGRSTPRGPRRPAGCSTPAPPTEGTRPRLPGPRGFGRLPHRREAKLVHHEGWSPDRNVDPQTFRGRNSASRPGHAGHGSCGVMRGASASAASKLPPGLSTIASIRG